MHVLRVEHKETGDGPGYIGWTRLDSCSMPNWYSDHHPDETDIPAINGREFGFASVKQLRRWFGKFPDDCRLLAENNFHVVIFDVPRGMISIARHQAIFPRAEAKLCATFDIMRIAR